MKIGMIVLRNWWRDWRSGEWYLLFFALLVGIGSVATTGFLSERFDAALGEKSGEFLGADLVLTSPEIPEPKLLQNAPPLHSSALDFVSMVAAHDRFQMASVRAVDNQFPLRGKVLLSHAQSGTLMDVMAQPEPGHIYVDPQILQLLTLAVGDTLAIGESDFIIAAMIRDEPGRAGSAVFGVSPRIFMRLDEVAKTAVVQPGSRVNYLNYYAGNAADLTHYRQYVTPLLNKSQQLLGGREGNNVLAKAFAQADHFFSLAGLVSLMLSSVAIVLAARRYWWRHIDTAALLRCFGFSSRSVLLYFATQLFFTALLAAVFGIFLGWLAQHYVMLALSKDLAAMLPLSGWRSAAMSIASGLLALTAATLPSLLQLARVPTMRVLRRDLGASPWSSWISAASCVLMFVGLMIGYVGFGNLLFGFIAGIAGLIMAVTLIAYALLRLGQVLQTNVRGPWRFALAQLTRHRSLAMLQLGAFAISLFLIMAVAFVRNDLIASWQDQLPANAPNHFVVNINSDEVEAVQHYFSDHKLRSEQIYPMVRGRLISINDQPVEQAVPVEARDDNALQRELNLTWSAVQPDNNEITEGQWSNAAGGLSLESELANRLGIHLGDSLQFRVGEQLVSAKVASLRKVDWSRMQPGFFVIFAPGALENLPHTYMTALRSDETGEVALAGFVQRFPTITLISVGKILQDTQHLIDEVTMAVEVLLGFLMLSGCAVLLAALLASLDERLREAAVLRALGAQKRFLSRSIAYELLLLGTLAGALAAVGNEVLARWMTSTLFEVPAHWHPGAWLVTIAAGASLVTLFGQLAMRSISRVSALTALREQG